MKRLVVLGAGGRQDQWLEDLLRALSPKPRFAHAESLGMDCDGLLVVDDGSPDGFAAIRSALAFRDQRPDIPIAVVTTLDGKWSDGECLARSRRQPGQGLPAHFNIDERSLGELMGTFDPGIDVRIDKDAVMFEYNG